VSRLPRTPLEATVDGFTHGGDGVARIDGKAVFVPGALPGERVRVRVEVDRKRWARAKLLDVLEAAPDRVAPPCPYAADCGGCDLQHVTPAGQLELKTRVVREQLQRIGRIEDPPVRDCVAVGTALGYRSQARMHATDDGRLGFHRRGTNDVVPVDRCIVLTDGAQSVRDGIGDATGAVEAALHATSTGNRAAVLTPGSGSVHLDDVPADLGVGVRRDHRVEVIRGTGIVAERVADLDFEVAAGGFFQANVPGAEALVAAVLAEAMPGGGQGAALAGQVVWDLYAGVGLFSLPLARAGARVTAVEVVREAVGHLRDNAARAGLASRVEAIVDDVARFAARAVDPSARRPSPDLVVLDPPRTGAGSKVMADLAGADPATIVYVACDPAALARDAKALGESGFHLRDAQPFDLFPMTHHVEVVTRFTR